MRIHHRASAFTLFEVMVSLLVMTTAMLATIALLPVGIKAQQLARSQVFASAAALTLINNFHSPVNKFDGISQLAPRYNGIPNIDTTDPNQLPYVGWASQLRAVNVHSSPYQPNLEQQMGWLNGVMPVPPEIARRLDSDGDEIQKVLDQDSMIFYPDPNFMMGLNQGAAADKTMQVQPSPELQKLVFAVTSLPQQNALSSQPIESWPWYEVYPFPPEYISMQAHGREMRRLIGCGENEAYNGPTWYTGNIRVGWWIPPFNGMTGCFPNPNSPLGARSGVSANGRGTGDWTWCMGGLIFDDGGHGKYQPVTFGLPMRPGQDVYNYCPEKPIDDPDSNEDGNRCDTEQAFYEGNGFYHGRNWRYFVNKVGGLWKIGNGLGNGDPMYSANATQWAWVCFQRLSGADANYISYPGTCYTNVMMNPVTGTPFVPYIVDPLNNNSVPGVTVSLIHKDTINSPAATVAVAPAQSFPSHPPAMYNRSGWLPIRALLCNPDWPCYNGLENSNPCDIDGLPAGQKPAHWAGGKNLGTWWGRSNDLAGAIPAGVDDTATALATPGGPNGTWWNQAHTRLQNFMFKAGQPQTCAPPATYEMRANYRDRALDLWRAVMPTNSGLAVLKKNYESTFDPECLVNDAEGGTMVDCNKYEYPPSELDKFNFISPRDLKGGDMPIHPAQVMALSYLAHAAMMVTGYSPPFGEEVQQSTDVGIIDTIKIPWECLNWTYKPSPAELTSGNVTEVALNEGVTKDALIVVGDVAGGATSVTLKNDTKYAWNIYPGDEIVFEPSYQQWWARYNKPFILDGSIWGSHDNKPVWMGTYDSEYANGRASSYPSLNYKCDTYRVVTVNGAGYGSPIPASTGQLTITFSPPLPSAGYPTNFFDARTTPAFNAAAAVPDGTKVRRVASPSDFAFARKVHEMCMQWAAAYASETPQDWGAPRMANHQTMMDKPLTMFDLFCDATNPASYGNAIRVPRNPQTSSAANLDSLRSESFYRWMVPNNYVPDSWFYGGTAPSVGRHDLTSAGPGRSRTSYFNQMVHNVQLAPQRPDEDEKHFWLTKPFSAFHRCRSLTFWSVDWKSYEDAELVPSAPVDWAKHDRMIFRNSSSGAYSFIAPAAMSNPLVAANNAANSAYNAYGHNPLCGHPESLYMWVNGLRNMRYVDLVGGESGGYLYQNWYDTLGNSSSSDPPTTQTGGQWITADVHLGHWGADRNGNGRLDYGPIPKGTRMKAVKVGEFYYYDPVIRLNVNN